MSFLKSNDKQRRLYLQLQGFLSNTYVDKVGEMLSLPNFKLPQVAFSEPDIKRLKITDNLRLGNRLERFFSFLIQESDQYEMIAQNLQIIEHKRTLGELDFIVFDTFNKEYIHIEFGGKVYVYNTKIKGELIRWIGPNRRDSLLKKTAKLKNTQFPLLYREATKVKLQELPVETNRLVQKVCFKARLFLPHNYRGNKPSFINEDNIKGYYINWNNFLQSECKEYGYFIPEKQDWIVNPKYGENWFSFLEIIKKVEYSIHKKQSPLVWIKKSESQFETIIVVWW